MIFDENKENRQRAANYILYARHNGNEARKRAIKRVIEGNCKLNVLWESIVSWHLIYNTYLLLDREKEVANSNIRHFILPNLNFDAQCLWDVLNWDTEPLYSPPLLEEFNDNQILAQVDDPKTLTISFYPCHSQATERFIQLVS